MKLTAKDVIDAPQDAVWKRLTEFDRYEKMASQTADVTRVSDGALPAWDASVEWRGVPRSVHLCIVDQQGPEVLKLVGDGSGLKADAQIKLTSLGDNATEFDVTVELRGTSLGGKAILQGLKVARKKIEERFSDRVGSIAKAMSKGLS